MSTGCSLSHEQPRRNSIASDHHSHGSHTNQARRKQWLIWFRNFPEAAQNNPKPLSPHQGTTWGHVTGRGPFRCNIQRLNSLAGSWCLHTHLLHISCLHKWDVGWKKYHLQWKRWWAGSFQAHRTHHIYVAMVACMTNSSSVWTDWFPQSLLSVVGAGTQLNVNKFS